MEKPQNPKTPEELAIEERLKKLDESDKEIQAKLNQAMDQLAGATSGTKTNKPSEELLPWDDGYVEPAVFDPTQTIRVRRPTPEMPPEESTAPEEKEPELEPAPRFIPKFARVSVEKPKKASRLKFTLPTPTKLFKRSKKEKPRLVANQETAEEINAAQETKNLSPEDKEKIAWGLSNIGFKAEKAKDDLLVKVFDNFLTKKLDKKGTAGRFIKELRDTFERGSKEALKKANDPSAFYDSKIGVKKLKINISAENKKRLANVGAFSGNVLKYGRLLSDATGLTPGSIQRLLMISGMATATIGEASKEARLKSDAVLDKTQIKDINKAEEEAWKIYESLGGKINDQGGGENVSAEQLKNAYLKNIPHELQERLKNPSTANNFVQAMVRKQVKFSINRLNNKLNNVGYKFEADEDDEEDEENGEWVKVLTDEEIEIEKLKILKKWEKDLKDYDRIVTEYGAVDGLAMAGRYAQKVGKGVVLGTQVQTLYKSIIHIPKLFENISHIVSGHYNAHEALVTSHKLPETKAPVTNLKNEIPGTRYTHGGPGKSGKLSLDKNVNTPHTQTLKHVDIKTPTGGSGATGVKDIKAPTGAVSATGTQGASGPIGHTGAEGASGGSGAQHNIDTQTNTPPTNTPDHTATEAPKVETPTPENSDVIKVDNIAVIHKGEGIENAFRRQIEQDHELAKTLGFKGDVADAKALHEFSGGAAHRIALDKGYVDNTGHEVWVKAPDKVAFELKADADGNIIVDEKTLDGNMIGEYSGQPSYPGHPGEHLDFGKNANNPYEYEHEPPTIEHPHASIPTETHPEPTVSVKMPNGDLQPNASINNWTPDNHDIDTIRGKVLEQLHNTPIHHDQPGVKVGTGGQMIPEASHAEAVAHVTQASTIDVDTLKSHPEFLKNPFNLSQQELVEVYKMHEVKLHQIFPTDTETAWKSVSKQSAHHLYEQAIAKGARPGKGYELFADYFLKLKNVTKLTPKSGGWFRKAETVGQYFARAEQSAEKNHQLSLLK